MTKNKKILIGFVSIILLLGLYYLYSINNTKFLKNYNEQMEGDNSSNLSFWQKCERSGGKIKKETECTPTTGSLLSPSCIDKNIRCTCPVFTIWTNSKGCRFL